MEAKIDELSSRYPAIKRAVTLWRALAEPAASVTDPQKQQRARFMSSLLLLIGISFLLIQPIFIITNLGDSDVAIKSLFSASIGFVVLWCYTQARRGRLLLAEAVSSAFTGISIFVLALMRGAQGIPTLYYPMLIIAFLALFASAKIVLVALALILALMFAFAWLLPDVSVYQILDGPSTFTLLITLVMIVAVHFNKRIYQAVQTRLLAEQTRQRALLQAIPDLIFRISADGHYVDHHLTEGSEMHQYSSLFVGKHLTEVLPPEYANEHMATIREVLKTGGLIQNDYPYEVDGQTFFLEVRTVRASENEVISTVRNVTDRKRAENTLRANEHRYRALFENNSDAVFIMGLDGCHVETNRRAVEMFGYAHDELIGMHMLRLVDAEEQLASKHMFERLLAGDQLPIYERRFRHKDGSLILAEVNIALIHNNDGTPLHVQSILHDVTERAKLEQERLKGERLRVALEKERELNKLKTDLMVTISHEFRTPLSLIMTSKEILERYHAQLTPEQTRQRMQMIGEQVHHLTRMLDDISTYVTRSRRPDDNYTPVVLNLPVFLTQVIENFRVQSNTQQRVELALLDEIGRASLDGVLLTRTINGLLSNAVKYSPPNSTIRVEVCAAESELKIAIRDQGIGIPPDERERIFEPFFRGSNVEGVGGTGLGLCIIQEDVRLMNGTIAVAAIDGGGTVFTLHLPFTVPPETIV